MWYNYIKLKRKNIKKGLTDWVAWRKIDIDTYTIGLPFFQKTTKAKRYTFPHSKRGRVYLFAIS